MENLGVMRWDVQEWMARVLGAQEGQLSYLFVLHVSSEVLAQGATPSSPCPPVAPFTAVSPAQGHTGIHSGTGVRVYLLE